MKLEKILMPDNLKDNKENPKNEPVGQTNEIIRNYLGKNHEAKDGWKKIEKALLMFGNEKARQEFLELPEEYYKKYRAQKHSEITGWTKKWKDEPLCIIKL